jgi:hypothetical protein
VTYDLLDEIAAAGDLPDLAACSHCVGCRSAYRLIHDALVTPSGSAKQSTTTVDTAKRARIR